MSNIEASEVQLLYKTGIGVVSASTTIVAALRDETSTYLTYKYYMTYKYIIEGSPKTYFNYSVSFILWPRMGWQVLNTSSIVHHKLLTKSLG